MLVTVIAPPPAGPVANYMNYLVSSTWNTPNMSTSDSFYKQRLDAFLEAAAVLMGYACDRAHAAKDANEYSGPCDLALAIKEATKAAEAEREAVAKKYAADEKAPTQPIMISLKRRKEVAA